ncbi:MAG: AraC family transcriptional regulator [Candidatus Omnitrophica bacterium]|nr:AraC family transcriptional regulator [Candidatus Omnitrophota bacterium]
MNDSLLQHIQKISLMKHNRDLIHSLCGIDIEIRRIDGTAINSAAKDISRAEDPAPASQNKTCTCSEKHSNCLFIDSEILGKIYDTYEPQTYSCAAGIKKIVIPIVINNSLVGLLFTGETNTFRFNGDQLFQVIKLLTNFTEYVIKNELTPLDVNFFQNGEITRQRELLNRAVRYIKQNYHCNDLTLKEVSTNNGISYHYLSRIFKKELDTTFAQFRNQVRMEAAKKMLKNRSLSISQISYACGFDDPAYFCKVFKNSLGASPTNYRVQEAAGKQRIL